jgi:hypothetical protein
MANVSRNTGYRSWQAFRTSAGEDCEDRLGTRMVAYRGRGLGSTVGDSNESSTELPNFAPCVPISPGEPDKDPPPTAMLSCDSCLVKRLGTLGNPREGMNRGDELGLSFSTFSPCGGSENPSTFTNPADFLMLCVRGSGARPSPVLDIDGRCKADRQLPLSKTLIDPLPDALLLDIWDSSVGVFRHPCI